MTEISLVWCCYGGSLCHSAVSLMMLLFCEHQHFNLQPAIVLVLFFSFGVGGVVAHEAARYLLQVLRDVTRSPLISSKTNLT